MPLYLMNAVPDVRDPQMFGNEPMVKGPKRPHVTAASAPLGVVRNTGSLVLLNKLDVNENLNVIPTDGKILDIQVGVKDKINSQRLGLFCLLQFYNLALI